MADINDIYDELYSLVSTTLGDHIELSDAYEIDENDYMELAKGYGISFIGSQRLTRNATCQFSIERTIQITNTAVIYGGDRDKSIKKTFEKMLLTNQELIIDAIENSWTLNDTLDKIEFVGDDGIKPVFSNEENIVMLQSRFNLEYTKNFN